MRNIKEVDKGTACKVRERGQTPGRDRRGQVLSPRQRQLACNAVPLAKLPNLSLLMAWHLGQ